MFHNKSDGFLDAVGDGRIEIVGAPADADHRAYHEFDRSGTRTVEPDLILPAIGYRSTLEALTGGRIRVRDFWLGCCHAREPDLFLVGHARPIIGNVPAISEMQARYITGLLGGWHPRPERIGERHAEDRRVQQRRYPMLDHDAVYPVEMFVYCDRLARAMGIPPRPAGRRAIRHWLAPATTMDYAPPGSPAQRMTRAAPVYMPPVLVVLLGILAPPSLVIHAAKRVLGRCD